MSLGKILRALVIAVLLSALVYTVMVVLSDGRAVASALGKLSAATVLLVLGMSTLAYVLRAVRWGWLMARIGYPVRLADALYLHLSGQTMGVSPGRVGEVFKPYLAREVAKMPMGVGLALVFSERVADLIAVCILALGGLTVFGKSLSALAAVLAVVLAGTALASSEWFHRLALRVLGRQRWAKRHMEVLASASDAIQRSLTWRMLALSVPMSVVAWGLEGLGLWLLLRTLDPLALAPLAAVSLYAVSTLVGAFTFLPAGIGFTEASLAGVLVAADVAASSASVATLTIRVATLWWSVLLGWIALSTRPAVLRGLSHAEADLEANVT